MSQQYVHRVTLFKIPKVEDQEALLSRYKVAQTEAIKVSSCSRRPSWYTIANIRAGWQALHRCGRGGPNEGRCPQSGLHRVCQVHVRQHGGLRLLRQDLRSAQEDPGLRSFGQPGIHDGVLPVRRNEWGGIGAEGRMRACSRRRVCSNSLSIELASTRV